MQSVALKECSCPGWVLQSSLQGVALTHYVWAWCDGAVR